MLRKVQAQLTLLVLAAPAGYRYGLTAGSGTLRAPSVRRLDSSGPVAPALEGALTLYRAREGFLAPQAMACAHGCISLDEGLTPARTRR